MLPFPFLENFRKLLRSFSISLTYMQILLQVCKLSPRFRAQDYYLFSETWKITLGNANTKERDVPFLCES